VRCQTFAASPPQLAPRRGVKPMARTRIDRLTACLIDWSASRSVRDCSALRLMFSRSSPAHELSRAHRENAALPPVLRGDPRQGSLLDSPRTTRQLKALLRRVPGPSALPGASRRRRFRVGLPPPPEHLTPGQRAARSRLRGCIFTARVLIYSMSPARTFAAFITAIAAAGTCSRREATKSESRLRQTRL
jgi:hypothetical protein